MLNISELFSKKQLVPARLIAYGFSEANGGYTYSSVLPESRFRLTVTVKQNGEISTVVTDTVLNEEYLLHRVEEAVGSFVGTVRTEFECVITDIAEKCFVPDVFKSAQTKELIGYVRDTYGDEPEFLWKKFSDNAVWRRKDTAKWYGALLTVSKRKLGIKSDETAEILDLRIAPEKMEALIDNKLYFSGWHMNKKNWYTVILDGSVASEELFRRIDESYLLATK